MQPSLSAQQGQVTGPAVTFSTRKYNDVRFLATCSMRMETAAILILRKVLNPDFPAHQAIIDQSEASMPHQEANSPPAASPAPVNAAVLNRTGIKRERGAKDTSGSKAVKTEPGSSNGRSNRQVECVDLSNMVAPVTSRARRGQKSECIDLT